MLSVLAQIIGGVGFFLLGMDMMTDGLKSVAGDSLRTSLQRFTRGPVTGTVTGAVVTAITQSSSATTLATIGFVSAGLLPFTNAIGLIFGANIGTTTTGWLVSLFGLRFSISAFAMPMVGVGILTHLFGRGKFQPSGYVLAGFGLIFVAIDVLQAGMGDLAMQVDLGSIASEGLGARLLLVLVGMVMTILLQSSTVALVTTMAALHSGALDLVQAAALVVGQNVGTTFTAALAMIGASTAAKRTALAHVLFNVVTAVIAFVALPAFVAGTSWVVERLSLGGEAVMLAAFHSLFSLVGIAILLPFVGQFAAMIERLIVDRRQSVTIGLDVSAAEVPVVALEATRNALLALTQQVIPKVEARVHGAAPSTDASTSAAIAEVRSFLSVLATQPSDDVLHARHVALLHVADHLETLNSTLLRAVPFAAITNVRDIAEDLGFRALLQDLSAWLETPSDALAATIQGDNDALAARRRALRRETLSRAATGAIRADDADHLLDYIGWLDDCAYHLARMAHYLATSTVPLDEA